MKEIWKDVVGYEGYYKVSNLGNVYSFPRKHTKGGLLKGKPDKNNYLRVTLTKNSKQKLCGIHRLVAIAFLPNINNLPMINHKDENPKNNNVDNLEWCDAKYNNNYGTRNIKIGQKHKGKYVPKGDDSWNARKIYQCDKNGNIIKKWNSIVGIERTTGYSATNIKYCLSGKQHYSYGFIWRYCE